MYIVMLISSCIIAPLFVPLFSGFAFERTEVANGIAASATVLDCQYIPSRGKINAWMDFTLSYLTQGAANTIVQGKTEVGGDFMNGRSCNEFPLGSTVQVKYQQTDPTYVNIVDDRLTQPLWDAAIMYGSFLCTFVFVTALFLTGLSGIIRFAIKLRQLNRLRRDAMLRGGEIIKCESEKQGKYENMLLLTVSYKFPLPQGAEAIGKQQAYRNDLLHRQLPEPGTTLTVLYADDHTYCVL